MSDIKSEVTTALKKRNKNISEGTVITYVSVLKSLMKRMGVTDIKKLDDATNVIPEINKMTSPQSIKTTLSALYVTTGHDKYKQEMIKYSEIVNKLYAQKKT